MQSGHVRALSSLCVASHGHFVISSASGSLIYFSPASSLLFFVYLEGFITAVVFLCVCRGDYLELCWGLPFSEGREASVISFPSVMKRKARSMVWGRLAAPSLSRLSSLLVKLSFTCLVLPGPNKPSKVLPPPGRLPLLPHGPGGPDPVYRSGTLGGAPGHRPPASTTAHVAFGLTSVLVTMSVSSP